MFGRKKKTAGQTNIALWDGAGRPLYEGRLTGLTLTEEMIKGLSLRFFDDPEPCEIHRSAVLKRVFIELQDALPPGEAIDLDGIGAEPRAYFSAYPAARRVRLWTE